MMGTCFEHRESVIDGFAQSGCFDQLERLDTISIVEKVAAENVHGAPLWRRAGSYNKGQALGK